jgi:hypothetical protein
MDGIPPEGVEEHRIPLSGQAALICSRVTILMDLAVAVVNWNSGAYLDRLLDSLAPLSHELSRTIVVDNASSDQSVARKRSAVEYRLLDRNHGFAGAANLAIDQACPNTCCFNLTFRLPRHRPRAVSEDRGSAQNRYRLPSLLARMACPNAISRFARFRLWSVFADALFLTIPNVCAPRRRKTQESVDKGGQGRAARGAFCC